VWKAAKIQKIGKLPPAGVCALVAASPGDDGIADRKRGAQFSPKPDHSI
jgi:hypothetical protein